MIYRHSTREENLIRKLEKKLNLPFERGEKKTKERKNEEKDEEKTISYLFFIF